MSHNFEYICNKILLDNAKILHDTYYNMKMKNCQYGDNFSVNKERLLYFSAIVSRDHQKYNAKKKNNKKNALQKKN